MTPKKINRVHEVCLVCGRPSVTIFCPICRQRLNEEARHEHARHEVEKLHREE